MQLEKIVTFLLGSRRASGGVPERADDGGEGEAKRGCWLLSVLWLVLLLVVW